MKTEIATNRVKTYATLVLILLSSFLLSFSLVNYFIFDKKVSAAVLIISAIVFGKRLLSMQKMRNK